MRRGFFDQAAEIIIEKTEDADAEFRRLADPAFEPLPVITGAVNDGILNADSSFMQPAVKTAHEITLQAEIKDTRKDGIKSRQPGKIKFTVEKRTGKNDDVNNPNGF